MIRTLLGMAAAILVTALVCVVVTETTTMRRAERPAASMARGW